MFFQIFLFELKYRIQRPGPWLCFLIVLSIGIMAFTLGHVPISDKEFINSPAELAFFLAVTSMPMLLISSAIMGVPLYRDIEYNTKEYYLSYPISKAGYFYGRFLGSLFVLLIIGAGAPIGAWLGSTIGRMVNWREAGRYGPQHFIYYLHPYLTIALPNMIFTSSLFFGLVAATRNIKVIYSSGLILFMGYLIANFALQHTHNLTVINLCDPFGIGPVRLEEGGYTLTQKNTSLLSIHDSFLINRIAWPSIGLIVLLVVYARFSFEKFFSGRADKRTVAPGEDQVSGMPPRGSSIPIAQVSFAGNYHRRTLFTLTRIELLNIIRDNYFWLILSSGTIFMSLIFWNTGGRYGLSDLPRTFLMIIGFNENFLFFVFIVLIFYTGETIHREKLTRYSAISDSLPPPNWVLNNAKLLSLLSLAVFLALYPILIGIGVQLVQGYTRLDLPLYLTNFMAVDLPLFVEMVLFAFMLHILINNKFVALGIGIGFWIAIAILRDSGRLDYLLLLYSNTPNFIMTEIDGLGPMAKPLFWFHLYWLLCGSLFLVLAALFYNRGVIASFRERLQLAKERWGTKTRITAFLLLAGFLAAGSYIYYNVSYLHNYLTRGEDIERKVFYEQRLKHYDGLPLPSPVKIRMMADLFPAERRALVHAYVTVINRSAIPIDSFLLDGDNAEYTLRYGGVSLTYSCPLIYKRGKFDLFRPSQDTAEFRLYRLPQALAPGQEIELEVNAKEEYSGFSNSFRGASFLDNFIFFGGGLPGLGYDEDDELDGNDTRKEYHLPEKKPEIIPHGDPRGINNLLGGGPGGLYSLDITISTAGDQVVVAPGTLLREWQAGGRHYYHYAQDAPGMYHNFGMFSGKYRILHDSAITDGGRVVPISIYNFPGNDANLGRFLSACKDGLRYYSHVLGPYPFDRLTVLELPAYAPDGLQLPGLLAYSESFGWNAKIIDPDQLDYPYYVTIRDLAAQWWGQQVAPNNTIGSQDISEGLSVYCALMEERTQKGMNAFRVTHESEIGAYHWGQRTGRRIHESMAENPLLTADRQYVWEHKTGLDLYGLSDLIGADSVFAALRELQKEFAFRSGPPYAGSDDLYRILQRHTPEPFRYYLQDGWEKYCTYQNKVMVAKATPLGKKDTNGPDSAYRVTLRVSVGKQYRDSTGIDHPAGKIDDYIDIGIFAADTRDRAGMKQINPLWLEKRRLSAGEHILTIIVRGRPARAAIDPYRLVMEESPQDNWKDITFP